jgi:hypothetical protein
MISDPVVSGLLRQRGAAGEGGDLFLDPLLV